MAEEKHQESSIGSDLAGNKLIWIAGAIILLIAGWFGLKAIFSSMESYRLTLVDAPKEVNASSVATFTWRIDGPATTIHHTSVYLGTESQTGELGLDANPESTKYNLSVKDFESGDYNIPLQFIGNIIIDNPGTYYYRVQASIKDKNYWTDEYTLTVTDHKISIIDAPKVANQGDIFTLTWRVDGVPTTIQNTAIYYGSVSTPGTLGKEVVPVTTKYTDQTEEFLKGEYTVPLQFVGNVKIASPGSYFYRGHAVIDGQNFWTDEYSLEVSPKVTVSPEESETTPKSSPTLSEEENMEELPSAVSPTGV